MFGVNQFGVPQFGQSSAASAILRLLNAITDSLNLERITLPLNNPRSTNSLNLRRVTLPINNPRSTDSLNPKRATLRI